MHVGFVATALHHLALLGRRGMFAYLICVAMKLIETCCNQLSLGVMPRPIPDPIPRVFAAGAEISCPGLSADARRLGQFLAMCVRLSQTAQISAIARVLASDEKADARVLACCWCSQY